MKVMAHRTLAAAAALMFAGVAWADDLTGEDRFLCAAASVIVCFDDGECFSTEAWELNVPQFINIDMKKGNISTTKASGESRSTDVDDPMREDGRIYLQGVDRGRVFGFVIQEDTGFMTAAIAHGDLTVTVFGACTPTR